MTTSSTELAVETIYDEEVRLTAWHLQGTRSLWLHLYDEASEPSRRPEDDSSFFSGIALSADAATRLGTALLVAAKSLETGSRA
ncbi:MAG: hypothetical protein JWO60_3416 [Frankiales bacterium]|nr:hypothetical protein [Frankiales bacterium]